MASLSRSEALGGGVGGGDDDTAFGVSRTPPPAVRVPSKLAASRRLRYDLHMGFENGRLVRVTLRATSGLNEQINTLHYDLQDSALNADNDPQTLADVFRDDVIDPWRALFSDNWTIEPVVVQEELDPLNPNEARQSWTSGTVQGGSKARVGDPFPAAVCDVATLRTQYIGRRFRGRLFLGGDLTEDDWTGTFWSTAQLNRFNNFLNAIPVQPDLATGTSDSVAHWCVYSRTQRAANADPYAAAVTDTSMSARMHWLRSRDS